MIEHFEVSFFTLLKIAIFQMLNFKPGVNIFSFIKQLFTTQSQFLTILKERAFENIVENEENGSKHPLLLCPQLFPPKQ